MSKNVSLTDSERHLLLYMMESKPDMIECQYNLWHTYKEKRSVEDVKKDIIMKLED